MKSVNPKTATASGGGRPSVTSAVGESEIKDFTFWYKYIAHKMLLLHSVVTGSNSLSFCFPTVQ